jgi:hypothetical protein
MARYFNPAKSSSRFKAIGTLVWLALIAMSASPCMAEERDPRWNYKGWTPSMSLALGIHSTDMEGFVLATDSSGTPIRPPQNSEDYAVTPLARISLGVETPELPGVPGHIRLFGSVDYFVTFPPDRKIASEGSPTGFFVRPGFSNPPEASIEGQGSETRVETNRSAYGLTGGMSIPVEIAGIRFHVKPGVSWMRYQWNIEGLVLRAIKPPTFGRQFRGVELRARGKLYSHGVGPYLAIELEPDPWGPILVSAFVEGAYYRALGNRDTDFSTSETYSGQNLPTDTYTGRWGIRVDDAFWRAAVGIRIYLAAD